MADINNNMHPKAGALGRGVGVKFMALRRGIKLKLKEYQNSKHKAHFFIKNRLLTISLFGVGAFLFYFVLSVGNNGVLSALKEGVEFGGIVSTGVMLLFYFYKDYLNSKIAKDIMTKPYVALFGLGEINRTFLKNRPNSNQLPVVIVESNLNSQYIQEYQLDGYSVITKNAYDRELLKSLDMHNTLVPKLQLWDAYAYNKKGE